MPELSELGAQCVSAQQGSNHMSAVPHHVHRPEAHDILVAECIHRLSVHQRCPSFKFDSSPSKVPFLEWAAVFLKTRLLLA